MNQFKINLLALTAIALSIGSGFLAFSIFHLSSSDAIDSHVRMVGKHRHGNREHDPRDNKEMVPRQNISILGEEVQNGSRSEVAANVDLKMKPRQRPPLPTALRDLTVSYYMVPKCGSRTFFYLIGQLKKINPNWQDVLALTSAESDVRVERTKEVPKFVMEAKKPAFLYVDTHFVNFKRPGNVMYISIVRDPMERFLSQFSFHISGDNLTAPQNDRDWVKTKESAQDQCIEQKRHICSGQWLGRACTPGSVGLGSSVIKRAAKTLSRGNGIC